MLFDLTGKSGGGAGNAWNYAHPDKDEFSTEIQGTVVEINKVQSINFSTKMPEFWPDGNPKANCQFVIQGQSGREKTWSITPKSAAWEAVVQALVAFNPNAQGIDDIGGLMIHVRTEMPPQGFGYSQGNPRPWAVQVLGQGAAQFRGTNDLIKNPPRQQPQQYPNQNPTQGFPPVQKPAPRGYQQQPQGYQPQPQQQGYQQQPQNYQQPQQQVDPMLQASMNSAYQNAQQQQEYVPATPYDQEIPF